MTVVVAAAASPPPPPAAEPATVMRDSLHPLLLLPKSLS